MTITEKIKAEYGTLKHFAIKEGLSYQSLRNTIAGKQLTQNVLKKLLEKKFIKSANELKKDSYNA